MKKLTLIICAILLCSFNITTSKTQIKNILTSGKWFVESIQESGHEPEMAENKNDEWIIFHEEGKLEENLYGEITNSTWEYSDKNKTIKIIGDKILTKRIIEISDNKLTIEVIKDINNGEVLMINYIK